VAFRPTPPQAGRSTLPIILNVSTCAGLQCALPVDFCLPLQSTIMQSNDSNIPAFPAFPCPSRYVALGAIEDAVSRISRAIDAREAAALVIGPPGTGKSLLCGLISKQYQPTHQVVLLGETPLDDRDAMLRHLLHRLGVEAKPAQDGDSHLALVDYINEQSDDEGLIIIVDEAQKLSADVIEAIRMVTNITRNGEPRIFALLCGGVKLDETLVDSSLESFTQRAATRCYLHPMNGEETRYYIHETIRLCGADPDSTITDEAIAAIHHACSGLPRLINQLISQAIDCAADADETLICEQFVDQAWAELQQLPSPMVEEPQIAAESSPIEFGELGESSDSVPWSGEAEVVEFDSNPIDQAPARYEPEPYQEAPCESAPCESAPCEQDQVVAGNDIQLESSSAVWVDEPEVGPSAVVEFGSEREQQPTALFGEFEHEEDISVGSGFAAQPQTQPATPANLETLLQQEIVGAGETIQISESNSDVIQFHPDDDRQPRRDDSDLLVIEDEVAVIPIDGGAANANEPQAISVDFQAMLTKMRGKN
jgi:type II secretory pathway predicted ATPase ExeA